MLKPMHVRWMNYLDDAVSLMIIASSYSAKMLRLMQSMPLSGKSFATELGKTISLFSALPVIVNPFELKMRMRARYFSHHMTLMQRKYARTPIFVRKWRWEWGECARAFLRKAVLASDSSSSTVATAEIFLVRPTEMLRRSRNTLSVCLVQRVLAALPYQVACLFKRRP